MVLYSHFCWCAVNLSFNQSIPDVSLVVQVEKVIKERDRLAYIDPEISIVEKQFGNDAFVKGLYLIHIYFFAVSIGIYFLSKVGRYGTD